MLVAAPSMANIGLQSQDDTPGILYEALWDLSVLEPFESFLNPEEPHCPVLAASEGFSRYMASPTPQLYLEDAHPLFFPTEELLCSIIDDDQAGSAYRSFLLPEICSPPLGLAWPPTSIGFAKCKESVQALGRAYQPFISLLDAIKPQLHHWFVAVFAHPERFSIPSCDYLEDIAPAFPSISDGTYPKQISDPRGFPPSPICNTHFSGVFTVTRSLP
jgi:hypothetical protein